MLKNQFFSGRFVLLLRGFVVCVSGGHCALQFFLSCFTRSFLNASGKNGFALDGLTLLGFGAGCGFS